MGRQSESLRRSALSFATFEIHLKFVMENQWPLCIHACACLGIPAINLRVSLPICMCLGQSVNLSISLSFVLLSYSLSLSLYLSLSLSLCRFSDADSTCIVFMLVIWLKSHCAQLCAHCLIVLAPLLHL